MRTSSARGFLIGLIMLVISSYSALSFHSAQAATGGIIAGTLSKETRPSPAHACIETPGFTNGNAWPYYKCSDPNTDAGYGCKTYSAPAGSSLCPGGTYTPDSSYSNPASSTYGWSCTVSQTINTNDVWPSYFVWACRNARVAGAAACNPSSSCTGCNSPSATTGSWVINTCSSCSTTTPVSGTKTCSAYYTKAIVDDYRSVKKVMPPAGDLTFNFPQLNVTPDNQLTNYCKVAGMNRADGVDWQPYKTPVIGGPFTACDYENKQSFQPGMDGSCVFRSDNYYIDSYNQLVGVLPPPGGSHRTSLPSASTYDAANASCTVAGLVGRADTPPVPTFTGSIDLKDSTGSFVTGDHWCNVKEYRDSTYGTPAKPFTPGCLFYSQKVGGGPTATPKNPDLFKGLNFKVSNTAGIYSVKVEIGSRCTWSQAFSNNKNTVLVSTTLSGWVKPEFQTLEVSYSGAAYNFGAGYASVPNLLTMFGKTRLDECLGEGKNFVQVVVVTLGQSRADGTMDQGSTGTGFFSKYVNVDESAPKLGVNGDAKTALALNGTNASLSCFGNGPIVPSTSDTEWKNFTLDGKLLTGDPFGNDAVDCSPKCTQFTQTGRTCSGTTSPGPDGVPAPKPTGTGIAWLAPAGVNPTTGAFTGMICDGLGPIPDVPSCAWGCSQAGYEYDSGSHACIKATSLFILFDGGTANATWPYAAKLSNDPTRSHGLVKSKSGSCAVPTGATSAIKFSDFSFLDTGNYQFLPEIETYPIRESGSWACVPTCITNAHTDWTTTPASCAGNVRAESCAPAPNPRGAMWAGTGWVYQTFSITALNWQPTLPATTYNSGAVSSACDYKCRSGYAWSGSVSRCEAIQAAPLPVTPVNNVCRAGGANRCIATGGGAAPAPAPAVTKNLSCTMRLDDDCWYSWQMTFGIKTSCGDFTIWRTDWWYPNTFPVTSEDCTLTEITGLNFGWGLPVYGPIGKGTPTNHWNYACDNWNWLNCQVSDPPAPATTQRITVDAGGWKTCSMDMPITGRTTGEKFLFVCRDHSWDNRNIASVGSFNGTQWTLNTWFEVGYYGYQSCSGLANHDDEPVYVGWTCPAPTGWICNQNIAWSCLLGTWSTPVPNGTTIDWTCTEDAVSAQCSIPDPSGAVGGG